MHPPTRTVKTPDGVAVGVRRRPWLADVYHWFLRRPWSVALGSIAAGFLSLNAVFALAYDVVGGVSGLHTPLDAYAFSVQTMATIGYGGMSPVEPGAHVLVIAEAVTGLLFTALSTGLVFAKFTLAPSSLRFATRATITPMDGVPSLVIRMGNERGDLVVDATVRVIMTCKDVTTEGVPWYRILDLPTTRSWIPAITRGWSVQHPLDDKSPLFGFTSDTLREREVEITVSVTGLDQTTRQPAHAMHRYGDDDVVFGMRHADMISTRDDGTFVLDVGRFDELVPAPLPTPTTAS